MRSVLSQIDNVYKCNVVSSVFVVGSTEFELFLLLMLLLFLSLPCHSMFFVDMLLNLTKCQKKLAFNELQFTSYSIYLFNIKYINKRRGKEKPNKKAIFSIIL